MIPFLKLWILMSAFSATLFACTPIPTNLGREIPQENLQKIKVNASTKAEVQTLLGKPETVTTSQTTEGTQELWTYFQTTINTGAGTSKGASHIITFNEQGVVIGVTTTTF